MLNFSKEEKMPKKRDTYRYSLKDDGKIVYYGITNDPERRRDEHNDEGKRFESMNVTSPVVTRDSAEQWEEERLEAYTRSHHGRTPRYNETKK